jgi:hypothetical protein
MGTKSQFVFIVVLALYVTLLIVGIEWKYGRLRKPWYNWLIIGSWIALPLFIFWFSYKVERFAFIIGITIFLAFMLTIPLRANLFKRATTDSGSCGPSTLQQRTTKWMQKHPWCLWLRETMTTGIVAGAATIAFGSILYMMADIEEWWLIGEPTQRLRIAAFCITLAVPTTITCVIAGLLSSVTIYGYGVIGGLIASLAFGVFVHWSRWEQWPLQPTMMICPVVGGFLGEVMVLLIKSLLKK